MSWMARLFGTGARAGLPALALLAVLAGCSRQSAPAPRFMGTDVTGAPYGRDFHLTDYNGKARSLADFKGKAVVMFFGYTHCPDVCPTTLSDLAQAMKRLGKDAERVQVLFVTVDPERDTRDVLARYVPAFYPSFLGLYGSPRATAATAREFHVFYRKHYEAGSDDYSVDHSAASYVFDPSGRLRLLWNYGIGVDAMVHDVKLLLG